MLTRMKIEQGTVATTVCSPADVLKSRIMNASGPGSSVRSFPVLVHVLRRADLSHFYVVLYIVNDGRDSSIARKRGSDVYVQRLAPGMVASATDNHSHIPHARAAERSSGLATGNIVKIWELAAILLRRGPGNVHCEGR